MADYRAAEVGAALHQLFDRRGVRDLRQYRTGGVATDVPLRRGDEDGEKLIGNVSSDFRRR
jgi:hypothetical protein